LHSGNLSKIGVIFNSFAICAFVLQSVQLYPSVRYLIKIINNQNNFTYRYIDTVPTSLPHTHTDLSLFSSRVHRQSHREQTVILIQRTFFKLHRSLSRRFNSHLFLLITFHVVGLFVGMDLILSSLKYCDVRKKFSVGKHQNKDHCLITVSRVDY